MLETTNVVTKIGSFEQRQLFDSFNFCKMRANKDLDNSSIIHFIGGARSESFDSIVDISNCLLSYSALRVVFGARGGGGNGTGFSSPGRCLSSRVV